MTAATEIASSSPPRAGLIGLGSMGRGVALRLMQAGIPLTVHSRRRESSEEAIAAGAVWADSPRAVGREVGSGVVFTALPEARDVERVLFGRRGLAGAGTAGALVVDLSTLGPDQSRRIAAKLQERSIGFLDVPMGGSADAARAGQLLLFAGGPEELLHRASPYLRPLAREIVHVGPVGRGCAMKLANNLLTIGTIELIGEALSLAEGAGIDRRRAIDILARAGGRSVAFESKRAAFAEGRYDPMFRLALARKDLRLVERLAAEVGRPVPTARQARRIYDRARQEGRGDQDYAAVVETVRTLGTAAPAAPAGPSGTAAPPSAGPTAAPAPPEGSSEPPDRSGTDPGR